MYFFDVGFSVVCTSVPNIHLYFNGSLEVVILLNEISSGGSQAEALNGSVMNFVSGKLDALICFSKILFVLQEAMSEIKEIAILKTPLIS